MRRFSVAVLAAYLVAAITAGIGLSIITGILDLNLEAAPRYLLGAVLILMGVYRSLMTGIKVSESKRRRKILDEDE